MATFVGTQSSRSKTKGSKKRLKQASEPKAPKLDRSLKKTNGMKRKAKLEENKLNEKR